MAKHVVHILFGKGEILCAPHKLFVKRRDEVSWSCDPKLAFTLDFGWDSPLDRVQFHAKAGKAIAAQVPANAPEGLFPYIVALYDKQTGFVYTFDPDMIVRH